LISGLSEPGEKKIYSELKALFSKAKAAIEFQEGFADVSLKLIDTWRFIWQNWQDLEEMYGREMIEQIPGFFVQTKEQADKNIFTYYQIKSTNDGPAFAVLKDRTEENVTAVFSDLRVRLTFEKFAMQVGAQALSGELATVGVFTKFNSEDYPLDIQLSRVNSQESDRPGPVQEPEATPDLYVDRVKKFAETYASPSGLKSIKDVQNLIGQAFTDLQEIDKDSRIAISGVLFSFVCEENSRSNRYIVLRKSLRYSGMSLFLLAHEDPVQDLRDQESIYENAEQRKELSSVKEIDTAVYQLLAQNTPQNTFSYIAGVFTALLENEPIAQRQLFLSLAEIEDRPVLRMVESREPDFSVMLFLANAGVREKLQRMDVVEDCSEMLDTLYLPIRVEISHQGATGEVKETFVSDMRTEDGQLIFDGFSTEEPNPQFKSRSDVALALADEKFFEGKSFAPRKIQIVYGNDGAVQQYRIKPLDNVDMEEDDEDEDKEDKDPLVDRLEQEQEEADLRDEKKELDEANDPYSPNYLEQVEETRRTNLLQAQAMKLDRPAVDVVLLSSSDDLDEVSQLSTTDVSDSLAQDKTLQLYHNFEVRLNNISTLCRMGLATVGQFADLIRHFQANAQIARKKISLQIYWQAGDSTIEDESNLVFNSDSIDWQKSDQMLVQSYADRLSQKLQLATDEDAIVWTSLKYAGEVDPEVDTQDTKADGKVYYARSHDAKLSVSSFKDFKRSEISSQSSDLVSGSENLIVEPDPEDPETAFLHDQFPLFDSAQPALTGTGKFMYDGYVFRSMREIQVAAPFLKDPNLVDKLLYGHYSADSAEERLNSALQSVEAGLALDNRLGEFQISEARRISIYQEAFRMRLFFSAELTKKLREFLSANRMLLDRLSIRQKYRIMRQFVPRCDAEKIILDEMFTGPDSKATEDIVRSIQANDMSRWLLPTDGSVDSVWQLRVAPNPFALAQATQEFENPGFGEGKLSFLKNKRRLQIQVLGVPRTARERNVDLYRSGALVMNDQLIEFPGTIGGQLNSPVFILAPKTDERSTAELAFRGKYNNLTFQRSKPNKFYKAGDGGGFSVGRAAEQVSRRAVIGPISDTGVPDTRIRLLYINGDDASQEELFTSVKFNLAELTEAARSEQADLGSGIFFVEPRDILPGQENASWSPGTRGVIIPSETTGPSGVDQVFAVVQLDNQESTVTMRNFAVLGDKIRRPGITGVLTSSRQLLEQRQDNWQQTDIPRSEALASFGNNETEVSLAFDQMESEEDEVSYMEISKKRRRTSAMVPQEPIAPTEIVSDSDTDQPVFEEARPDDDDDEAEQLASIADRVFAQEVDEDEAELQREVDELLQKGDERTKKLLQIVKNNATTLLEDPQKNPFLVVNKASKANLELRNLQRIAMQRVDDPPDEQIFKKQQLLAKAQERLLLARRNGAKSKTVEKLTQLVEDRRQAVEQQFLATELGGRLKQKIDELEAQDDAKSKQKAKKKFSAALKKASTLENPHSYFDYAWPFRAETDYEKSPDVLALQNKELLKTLQLAFLNDIDKKLFVPGSNRDRPIPVKAEFVIDAVTFSTVHEYVCFKLHQTVYRFLVRQGFGADTELGSAIGTVYRELITAPLSAKAKSIYEVYNTVYAVRQKLSKLSKNEKSTSKLRKAATQAAKMYASEFNKKFSKWSFLAHRAQIGQNTELFQASAAFFAEAFSEAPILSLVSGPLDRKARPGDEVPAVGGPKSLKFLDKAYQAGVALTFPSVTFAGSNRRSPKFEAVRLYLAGKQIVKESSHIKAIRQAYAQAGSQNLLFSAPEGWRQLPKDYAIAKRVAEFLASEDSSTSSLPQDVLAIDVVLVKMGSIKDADPVAGALLIHIGSPVAPSMFQGTVSFKFRTDTLVPASFLLPGATNYDARFLADLIVNIAVRLEFKGVRSTTQVFSGGARVLKRLPPQSHPQILLDELKAANFVSGSSSDASRRESAYVLYADSFPFATNYYGFRNKASAGVALCGRDFIVSPKAWEDSHWRGLADEPVLREVPLPFLRLAELDVVLQSPVFADGTKVARVSVRAVGSDGVEKEIYSTDWHPLTAAVGGRVLFLPYESMYMLDMQKRMRDADIMRALADQQGQVPEGSPEDRGAGLSEEEDDDFMAEDDEDEDDGDEGSASPGQSSGDVQIVLDDDEDEDVEDKRINGKAPLIAARQKGTPQKRQQGETGPIDPAREGSGEEDGEDSAEESELTAVQKYTELALFENKVLDWQFDVVDILDEQIQVPTAVLAEDRKVILDYEDTGVTLEAAVERFAAGDKDTIRDGTISDTAAKYERIFMQQDLQPPFFSSEERMCSFSGVNAGLEQHSLRVVVMGAELVKEQVNVFNEKTGDSQKRELLATRSERELFASSVFSKESMEKQTNLYDLPDGEEAIGDNLHVEVSPGEYVDLPRFKGAVRKQYEEEGEPADSWLDVVTRAPVGEVKDPSFGIYGVEFDYNNNLYNGTEEEPGVDPRRVTIGSFALLTKAAAKENADLVAAVEQSGNLKPLAPQQDQSSMQVDGPGDQSIPVGPADASDTVSVDVLPLGKVAKEVVLRAGDEVLQLAFSQDEANVLFQISSNNKENIYIATEIESPEAEQRGEVNVVVANSKDAKKIEFDNKAAKVKANANKSRTEITFDNVKFLYRSTKERSGTQTISALLSSKNVTAELRKVTKSNNSAGVWFALTLVVRNSQPPSVQAFASSSIDVTETDLGAQFASVSRPLIVKGSGGLELKPANFDAVQELYGNRGTSLMSLAKAKAPSKKRQRDSDKDEEANLTVAVPGSSATSTSRVKVATGTKKAPSSDSDGIPAWNGKPEKYFISWDPRTGLVLPFSFDKKADDKNLKVVADWIRDNKSAVVVFGKLANVPDAVAQYVVSRSSLKRAVAWPSDYEPEGFKFEVVEATDKQDKFTYAVASYELTYKNQAYTVRTAMPVHVVSK